MSRKNPMLAAAVAGVLIGATACDKKDDAQSSGSTIPASAATAGASKHACKGQNACKGQGGCKTDNHACKGQNACKGQGGCNMS